MTELTKLANIFKTDKGTVYDSAHGYTEFYDNFFNEIRNINILEIGVLDGASLKMLKSYFGKHAMIYGIDIEDKKKYEDEGIKTFIVDQSSRESLNNFKEYLGSTKFDIIIDDGSHIPEHQMITLSAFYDMLKINGIYILEDLHGNIADCYKDINVDTPLYFLNFMSPSKFLTEEENNNLLKSIRRVYIYNNFNDISPLYSEKCKNRSITSIIKFKENKVIY